MRATELMFRNPAQATPGFYDSDVGLDICLYDKPLEDFQWRHGSLQVYI